MSDLLADPLNLSILESVCSGHAVDVNISELSRTLKRHRNTIKAQVDALFDHDILTRPTYPFEWLFIEYPFMVIARVELPRNEDIDRWLKEDEHVFAAYYVRDDEYNTLVLEYHKDLYEYGEWRKRLIQDGKLPPRDGRYPAQAYFFDTRHIIKYKPHYPLYALEERMRRGKGLEINGYPLNDLCFDIMKQLMLGKGIQTNENLLSNELGVHRRTIERRLRSLSDAGIIADPVCRFPGLYVPPNQFLVICLIEVNCDARDTIGKAFKVDPSLTLVVESNVGRYSYLLFGDFMTVEDHIAWEENLNKRFPKCLGAVKSLYISPQLMVPIDHQKMSLSIIRRKRRALGPS